jgi:hypothetical protein
MEEARLRPEDALGQVYLLLLNDDPKKRGLLSEILLDGSYSDTYQYARESAPKTRLELRQSLAPLGPTNGIVVPYCPIDKKIGKEYPLWSVKVENGSLEVIKGADSSGHCMSHEIIGEMSPNEFEELKATNKGLTSDQLNLINSKIRKLEYSSGKAYLRCTFDSPLPKFQSFFHARASQAIKDIVDVKRKELGQTIPPAIYKELQELEKKEKEGTLGVGKDRSRLIHLREKYFPKKQKDLIHTTSLDAPSGGEDGDGRSQHEMISTESDEDLQSIEDARFELQRALGDQQLGALSEVARKVPLGTFLNKMQNLFTLPLKDPKRPQVEKELMIEATKLSHKYYGNDREADNTCNTCGFNLGPTSSACPQAAQMRSIIYSAYEASKDISQFQKTLTRLAPEGIKHYEASNLPTAFDKAFGGIEVAEDEIDLGLSGFESYTENIAIEKLSLKQLKPSIEQHLTEEAKKAYYGTDVKANLEVSEIDIEKSAQLAKYIYQVVHSVFTQELEEELAQYLIGYGAQ